MVGPPAAGKSYFAKNHLVKDDTWAYVSRDEIRFSIITEEDKYFSKEKEVFKSSSPKPLTINLFKSTIVNFQLEVKIIILL